MVSSFIHISTEDLRNTNKLTSDQLQEEVAKEDISISLIIVLSINLPTSSSSSVCSMIYCGVQKAGLRDWERG